MKGPRTSEGDPPVERCSFGSPSAAGAEAGQELLEGLEAAGERRHRDGLERPKAQSQTSHMKSGPRITPSGHERDDPPRVEHEVADARGHLRHPVGVHAHARRRRTGPPATRRRWSRSRPGPACRRRPRAGVLRTFEYVAGSNGVRSASRSIHVRKAVTAKPPSTTHQSCSAWSLKLSGNVRAGDAEGLVGLLRELVEVVVKDGRDQQRAQADGDGRLRAPLEVADGHRARDGAEHRAGEGDEIGAGRPGSRARRTPRSGRRAPPRARGPRARRRAPVRLGAAMSRRPMANGRNALQGASAWPIGRDVEVERGVLRGARAAWRPTHMLRSLLSPGAAMTRAARMLTPTAAMKRQAADHVAHRVGLAAGADRRATAHARPMPPSGHAQTEQAAAATRSPRRGRPPPCRSQGRRAASGRGPLVVAIEGRDREAAERHGQAGHRADVAEHRPRLHEVERHRGQDDGGVERRCAGRRGARRTRSREHAQQPQIARGSRPAHSCRPKSLKPRAIDVNGSWGRPRSLRWGSELSAPSRARSPAPAG